MRKHFTNKYTQERRLIWFGAEGPTPQPESEAAKPTDGSDKAPPRTNLDEAINKIDAKPERGESPRQALDDASKGAADTAAEGAGEDAEAARAKQLKAASTAFKLAMDATAKGDPEAALKQVNKDGETFKLNADKTGIEFTETSGDTSPDKQSGGPKKLPKLTESEQQLKDAMISLGLDEKGAEEFARAMSAIAKALKALRAMFGKGGPEDQKEDPNANKQNKPKENGDNSPGGGSQEGGAGSPNEGGAGSSNESGDVTPGSNESNESNETLDVKNIQNPRTEINIRTKDVEALTVDEQKLETELDDLTKGDTNKESRAKMAEVSKKLGKIEDSIDSKQTEIKQLEDELGRRKGVIDTSWDAAKTENGLVKGCTLDTEDGDNIVVTLEDGMSLEDLSSEQKTALEALGLKAEGNTLVMEDVPPNMFQESGKELLDTIMNVLGGLKQPPENDEGGDFDGNAENKEGSPEQMVKALNGQLKELIASNGDFMKETPIGQIFTQMEYRVEGDNIMLNIPPEASAQLRSIMEANGRTVTKNEDGSYVIDGYPDGTKVDMLAKGAADYPSRLAWGGAEGDIKSQADAAKSGMDVWSKIVSTEPPANTEEVDAKVNDKLEIADPTSDGAKRIDSALTSLKGRLGSAVDSTVYGKFINSLDVGNNGDTIALTSNADAKTFSHMYQQMEMSGVTQGGVEKTADGKYVINIAEGDADNIVYNLERWSALMGSSKEGGDFEGGTEGDEDAEKEIPAAKDAPEGQIREDTDGNYWEKGDNGMWKSYSNAEAGMTSDSGYKETEWGDSLMDERTKSIVESTEDSDSESPESGNEESTLTPERVEGIRKDMGNIIGTRSGLPANEQVIVRNAIRIDESEGSYTVSVNKDLMNRGNFSEADKAAIVDGLSTTIKQGGNDAVEWSSDPMTGQELENYYASFITRINRNIS